MRIIEGLANLQGLDLAQGVEQGVEQSLDAHSVVTVGVFDGMHLGHLRLMHELLEMASALGGVPTVITFRNHPDQIINGQRPAPIISVPHRLRLLRRAGIQRCLLLDFDAELRQMSAATWAKTVLAQGLHCRGLLLGFDSALGFNREGTPARLTNLGKELGFTVQEGSPFLVDGQPVSSTAIRQAISDGNLDLGLRLLGRRPSAFGTVEQGDGRGRDLGFPTANLCPTDQVLPPLGVYAVEALHDGELFPAVANLGRRPTFAPENPQAVLEVHLLDQSMDLYGATLEVSFLRHLRDERRFASAAQLQAQIQQDIAAARQVFAS